MRKVNNILNVIQWSPATCRAKSIKVITCYTLHGIVSINVAKGQQARPFDTFYSVVTADYRTLIPPHPLLVIDINYTHK